MKEFLLTFHADLPQEMAGGGGTAGGRREEVSSPQVSYLPSAVRVSFSSG